MDKVLHSSKKMDWATPDFIYVALDEEFSFALDVACTSGNQKCWAGLALDKGYNGLEDAWKPLSSNGTPGACWMNPPYGREIGKWIQKAYDEKANGVTTVCLVPARTDTKWWSIFWDYNHHRPRDERDEVRFVKGRIQFEGAPHAAPFPSAIIVLRGKLKTAFCPKCQNVVSEDDDCVVNRRACGLAPAHHDWSKVTL